MSREIVQTEIREILERNQAMIGDAHLVLTSGKHSSGYINLRQLAGKIDDLDEISYALSEFILEHLLGSNPDNQPDAPIVSHTNAETIIVGPETMGRSLAHATAANSDICNISYAWCRPNQGVMEWDPKMTFAEQIKDRHCFIVDDVLTTAKSIKQTAELIRTTGGIVDGAAVVVRRDPRVTAETIGIPWLDALLDVDLPIYAPEKCPLCQNRQPIWLHPGHGHEWIKEHPDYPVKET